MPRRRQNEGVLELLVHFPWWVSVIVAVCVFFFLRTFLFESQLFEQLSFMPWLVAVVFLFPALASYIKQRANQQLLDRQRSLDSIKQLSWRAFESLLAEYYLRQGFTVHENKSNGPDGGIDLELFLNGQRHLVQCKRYRKGKVAVSVVREMYGVLISEGAQSMRVITTSQFTKDAIDFAKNKPLELIDGETLLPMILSVQQDTSDEPKKTTPKFTQEKTCPRCDGVLVIRLAKRGKNAGNEFFGCSGFPRCKYTQNISLD